MRICLKCLSVYASSNVRYCSNDGQKTFDAGSIEADEAIKKLKEKLEAIE